MSMIYLYEYGAEISFRRNQIVVTQKNGSERNIPIESVESVCIIGQVGFTSKCIREFLTRGIQLVWLSPSGEYFGKLSNTLHHNVLRQYNQFRAHEDADFCLALAKEWIAAKLRNQRTLLRRYTRYRDADITSELQVMGQCIEALPSADTMEKLMGYEGLAARNYFNAFGRLVPDAFSFEKRTRRPPTDPVNSLLSFAYTLLLYEIFSALTSKGLEPYIGFMHALRNGHPALCSDLMEEWRPVIADSLVWALIEKRSISLDDFEEPDSAGGIYLKKDPAKQFIAEYEKKIREQMKYLSYADYPVSFRQAIEMQVGKFVSAVEQKDPSLYKGVIIR